MTLEPASQRAAAAGRRRAEKRRRGPVVVEECARREQALQLHRRNGSACAAMGICLACRSTVSRACKITVAGVVNFLPMDREGLGWAGCLSFGPFLLLRKRRKCAIHGPFFLFFSRKRARSSKGLIGSRTEASCLACSMQARAGQVGQERELRDWLAYLCMQFSL
jgi:hypothetical protein